MTKNLKLPKSAVFLLLLLAAIYFAPSAFWSISYLPFLPKSVQLFLVLLALAIYFIFHKKADSFLDIRNLKYQKAWLLIFPIILAAIFNLFPINFLFYGDSLSIAKRFEGGSFENKLFQESILALLNPNLTHLHNGERLTFNIVNIWLKLFGLNYTEAFKLNSFLFAIGTASAYGAFVYLNGLGKQLIFFIGLFLSFGFLFNFQGHIEVYAAPIFFSSAFVLAIQSYLRKESALRLFFLCLSFFFMAKSHFLLLLLLPVPLYFLVIHFFPKAHKLSTWRDLKIFLAGAAATFFIAYFTVLNAADSNYALRDSKKLLSNAFLPLISSDFPYDSYGLFHPNHLLDFMVLLLGWTPILLLFIVYGIKKKRGDQSETENSFLLLILAFAFLTLALVAFVFNPLLSMPRDQDLLSLGSVFLAFALPLIFPHLSKSKVTHFKIVTIALIFLLSIPKILVLSNEKYLCKKLLSTGTHVYSSYYAGSSVFFSRAFRMGSELPSQNVELALKDLRENEKGAQPDYEISQIFTSAGLWYRDQKPPMIKKASQKFLTALEFSPDYSPAIFQAALSLQDLGNYEQALEIGSKLLNYKHQKKYYQLLINCAYKLRKKKELEAYCEKYVELYPNEFKKIQSILKSIRQ